MSSVIISQNFFYIFDKTLYLVENIKKTSYIWYNVRWKKQKGFL